MKKYTTVYFLMPRRRGAGMKKDTHVYFLMPRRTSGGRHEKVYTRILFQPLFLVVGTKKDEKYTFSAPEIVFGQNSQVWLIHIILYYMRIIHNIRVYCVLYAYIELYAYNTH